MTTELLQKKINSKLFWKSIKKCQTFSGFNFSDVSFCCFSLSFMRANEEYLDFVLLFVPKKQFGHFDSVFSLFVL